VIRNISPEAAPDAGAGAADRAPDAGAGAADRAPADELLDELTSWAPRDRLRAFRAWHRGSLSLVHLMVLALLEAEGPLSMSRLAEELDVSHASVTGVVDRMEERGIVERRQGADDRRLVLIRTTPAGAEVTRDLLARRRQQLRRVLAELSDDEQAALLRGMRALRAARERIAAGEAADVRQPATEPSGAPTPAPAAGGER
jgi:DNA-binding MarR family transcriptional regulator